MDDQLTHEPQIGELWQVTRESGPCHTTVVMVIEQDTERAHVYHCMELTTTGTFSYGLGKIDLWSFKTRFDWTKVSDGSA